MAHRAAKNPAALQGLRVLHRTTVRGGTDGWRWLWKREVAMGQKRLSQNLIEGNMKNMLEMDLVRASLLRGSTMFSFRGLSQLPWPLIALLLRSKSGINS